MTLKPITPPESLELHRVTMKLLLAGSACDRCLFTREYLEYLLPDPASREWWAASAAFGCLATLMDLDVGVVPVLLTGPAGFLAAFEYLDDYAFAQFIDQMRAVDGHEREALAWELFHLAGHGITYCLSDLHNLHSEAHPHA